MNYSIKLLIRTWFELIQRILVSLLSCSPANSKHHLNIRAQKLTSACRWRRKKTRRALAPKQSNRARIIIKIDWRKASSFWTYSGYTAFKGRPNTYYTILYIYTTQIYSITQAARWILNTYHNMHTSATQRCQASSNNNKNQTRAQSIGSNGNLNKKHMYTVQHIIVQICAARFGFGYNGRICRRAAPAESSTRTHRHTAEMRAVWSGQEMCPEQRWQHQQQRIGAPLLANFHAIFNFKARNAIFAKRCTSAAIALTCDAYIFAYVHNTHIHIVAIKMHEARWERPNHPMQRRGPPSRTTTTRAHMVSQVACCGGTVTASVPHTCTHAHLRMLIVVQNLQCDAELPRGMYCIRDPSFPAKHFPMHENAMSLRPLQNIIWPLAPSRRAPDPQIKAAEFTFPLSSAYPTEICMLCPVVRTEQWMAIHTSIVYTMYTYIVY